MSFGGGGSSPAPPAPPPSPPPAPTPVDTQVRDTRQDARDKARASSGFSNTILTSSQGLNDDAPTAQRTLLGQ